VSKVTQPDGLNKYITELNCASFEYEAKRQNRSIEDYLEWNITLGRNDWEIVIFDEIQGASDKIQTGMLKYLERDYTKTFFVFCTTEITKVIPTMRSRCLPIEFKSIKPGDVYRNIDNYARKKGISISDSVKEHIALSCNGHMRDAHIELSKYITVGEKDYIANMTSYYILIADMFIAAHKGDKGQVVECLNQLSFSTLFVVKREFENFIIDCGRAKYTGGKSFLPDVNRLLDEYGDDFSDIVDFYTGIWDNSLFSSDRYFYMHMLSFYNDLERKRSIK
jgi:hypothetical protein